MKSKVSKWMTAIAVAGTMLLSSVTALAAVYPDVQPGSWYYRPVQFVSDAGLMTGYADGRFGPSDDVTRGQFVTILYRAEGEPEKAFEWGLYSDVADGKFYSVPTTWSYYSKAMTGYEDGRFGVSDSITREQVATVLYRYASMKGLDMPTDGDLSMFPDGEKVSGFAKEGMSWIIGAGIITGDQGNINPQGKASRAQIATILERFAGWLVENGNLSIFEIMPTRFDFASGAGAWGTHINLQADGSFTGEYRDSNMGESGDGYPNGTVYICKFSGSFSEPTRLDKYTYSMNLERLELEGTPDEVYYKDDIRYIYSVPYGLANADEVLIYTPGAAISELPGEFTSWLHAFVNVQNYSKLPCYGLYNVNEKLGFAGVY